MRSTFASLAAFATTTLAHYNFEALIVNDEVTDAYEYVRQTTNANSPVTDVTSQDFVCNAGGSDADIMAKTATYTVQAGDSVGFTINANMGHPGPLHVYMSKAPDAAKGYDGSGDWFKVYSLTTSSITEEGLQWATYVDGGISNFTFALPADLAAGEYLMRGEHIALHGAQEKGGAQFYMGCAQIKIEGSGTATPTETVSIPGVYDGTEPGILINIYTAPKSYTDPGPATYPNACEDSSVNFAGQTSDGDCTGSTTGSSTSSGSSSSGSSSGGSTGSTSGSPPSATASGAGPKATGSQASAAGVNTGSSSSSSSSSGSSDSGSDDSDDSCASKRKRSAKKAPAYKQRAAPVKRGLSLMN